MSLIDFRQIKSSHIVELLALLSFCGRRYVVLLAVGIKQSQLQLSYGGALYYHVIVTMKDSRDWN